MVIGDERIYVDDRLTPQLYGTGTEEFSESGWYYRGGITFAMPLGSNPAYEVQSDGCQYDCTGAMRLYISAAINFLTGLRVGIEHGPVDNEPSIYSSVAFYYAQDGPAAKITDTIDVTNQQCRQQHIYSVAHGEQTYQLTSVFEGNNDKVNVTSGVTTVTGQVSFIANIDPANMGVQIFRIGDQQTAQQCANVYVDDQLAGVWYQPLGNTYQRWLNDDFDVSHLFTKGKSQIKITLTPVKCNDGPLLWSASQYQIKSIVDL